MSQFRQYLSIAFVMCLFMVLFTSYKGRTGKWVETKTSLTKKLSYVDSSSSGCDPEIWKHVYNPGRLKIIKNCITVSGIITESSAEKDGDQHMLLKPDKGQEGLLTAKNMKNKKGNLVIEAICVNKIRDSKVGDACKGYVNQITLPAVGSHVRVSGSLVLDTHNGWNEIHPISKIENQ